MRDILEIVFKRLRAILLILTVCFFTTLIGNYAVTTQFESETKLLIRVGREATVPTTAMTQPLNVFVERKDQINTQIQILKSRYLIEETLKTLPRDWETMNLTHNDSLLSRFRDTVKGIISKGMGGVKWLLEEVGLIPKISEEHNRILQLLKQTSVERVENTNVLKVSFRHPNPFACQAFLQAYLKVYMVANANADSSGTAMDFFTRQADASMEELKKAEEELSIFRNEANIYDLAQQKKNTSDEMTSLHNNISENSLLLESLGQDLKNYQNTPEEQVESNLSPSLRNDPIILETLKILVSSKLRLTKELKKLGTNHPIIVSLRGEVKSIRAGLKAEVINTLQSRIISLREEIDNLNMQLEALKQRAQDLDEKGIAMDQLQRKVNLLKQSFITYSQKQETSRINTMMDQADINSVAITQPPTMPIKPVSPKRMLNLTLSIFAGLVLGFFYAMLMEMLGATVNSPDEMSKTLKTNAQIFLPALHIDNLTNKLSPKFKNALQLLASKALHTQVKPPRILMITGAGHGVGVTSICAMLGRYLAECLGQKVLVVDANFLDQGLAQAFGNTKQVGLTDVLAGKTELFEAVTTASPTMDILSPGEEGLLPSTLLSISHDMRGPVQKLLNNYDLVLFDCPPLTGPESFNLAKVVDGVILVAQAEKTRRAVLQVAQDQLEQVQAKLVGSVLNQRKFHIPNWLYRYL